MELQGRLSFYRDYPNLTGINGEELRNEVRILKEVKSAIEKRDGISVRIFTVYRR